MKWKAAAALAVVLIPLLLLGGGVWVATVKRAARTSPSARVPSEAASSPVEKPTKTKTFFSALEASDPVRPPTTPVDRGWLKAEIETSLPRYMSAWRRRVECIRILPDSQTREEYDGLLAEIKTLNAEVPELNARLCELAAMDPTVVVDIVRSDRSLPDRQKLMGLIAPDVDAEFTSEDSLSGPLLSGLLALAGGDVDDRMHLAAFAIQLPRANHELARVLLAQMSDSDPHVRLNSAHPLSAFALRGGLRDYLASETAALRRLSLQELGSTDHHVRGSALIALASLKIDGEDDWVLQRFESATYFDPFTTRAMCMAAPRIAERNQARLLFALQRALECDTHDMAHQDYRTLAKWVPEPYRTEIKVRHIAKHAGKSYSENQNLLPRTPSSVGYRSTTRVTQVTAN